MLKRTITRNIKKSKTKCKRGKWVADFETCEWIEDSTYVWLWAVCNIETEETEWGTDINSFMEWCDFNGDIDIYFHNLKFDGEFILSYLFSNNYQYVSKTENKKEFSTIISDMGQFFAIEIITEKGKNVKFYDSFKIIPTSVDEIPKKFNLPIEKKSIDYKKFRPLGYNPTQEEIDYILNDVKIPALALKLMFDQGLQKITIAGNGLFDFKKILGKKTFRRFFPELPIKVDEEIRSAYRGGFTYLSPEYENIEVGNGIVIDVNSLYPFIMVAKSLPIGFPLYFNGKYTDDKWYDLYVQRITCAFELKPNKIPTIQIKGDPHFRSNEYLRDSKGKIVCLTLTNIDLELFFENYEVYHLEYEGGWKFRSLKGIFDNYIKKWYKIKSESDIIGLIAIAKLMLNALYGKFGLNPICRSKIPYFENNVVKYKITEPFEREPVYIPMAVFITSYAREKTIRTAQMIFDYSINKYGKNKFVYSDTDSCHVLLSSDEISSICDVHNSRLGAWKIENEFFRAKFIRQKCYIEENSKEVKICCAGLPKSCYDQVTFENFKKGLKVEGKLTYKHVKGGVKLVDTTFELKETDFINLLFNKR